MKKFALIGENVVKSKSKLIHENLFESFSIDAKYDLISVDNENFSDTVNKLKNEYLGFNITMPYKIKILDYLDAASEDVKIYGACNTVKVENGKLKGFNTDGHGFIKALGFSDAQLQEKNVLVLGAGGASCSIIYELCKRGASVTVCNRTPQKVDELRKKLNISFKEATLTMLFSNKCDIIYDIIINTTSVGAGENIGKSPLDGCYFSKLPKRAVDIIYYPERTKFLIDMQKTGVAVQNGFEMLFWQAYEAEKIWLNIDDDIMAKRVINDMMEGNI